MRCCGANELEHLFGVVDLSAALPPRHYGMLLQRVAAVRSHALERSRVYSN